MNATTASSMLRRPRWVRVVLIVLLVVFLVLCAQFESFASPIVITLTVPFAVATPLMPNGALALAGRFGLPAAIFGLVGGFAAPVLVGGAEAGVKQACRHHGQGPGGARGQGEQDVRVGDQGTGHDLVGHEEVRVADAHGDGDPQGEAEPGGRHPQRPGGQVLVPEGGGQGQSDVGAEQGRDHHGADDNGDVGAQETDRRNKSGQNQH